MKPGKNDDKSIENQNCSCTSCVYKSASDRPSLRRFIAKGSRIDRLYYGKYIPLRERKLLERLVRTRGVYDDIRAQLVSDSTLSSNKPDLNPEKRLPMKELQKDNNSSTILELVNMVDKGADLSSKKLSDCCSCCSCSSKIHVHERVKKTHRFRRGQRAARREYEYAYTKEKIGGEVRKKRGVRFKSKHIRSDPCFCTLKFSGLIKNQSKSLLKKLRRDHSVPELEFMQTTEENVKKQNKLQELSRASYEKLKETNTRIKEFVTEGAQKVRDSKNKVEGNIRATTKRSLERMKDAKDKVKQNIKNEAKKIQHETDLFFKIKKDSVIKFKDELKKKQMLKYWECEPECIEDTCVPEECYKKIKLRNPRKRKSLKKYGKDIRQDRKVGDLLQKSDIRIQSQGQIVNAKIGSETPQQMLDIDRTLAPKVEINLKRDKNNICECDITFPKKQDATFVRKQVIKPAVLSFERPSVIKEKKEVKENKIQTKEEDTEITPKPEISSNASENHAKVKIKKTPVTLKPKPEQKKSHRQAVRIGSSFSFSVEFYKEEKGSKTSRMESTHRDKKFRPELKYNIDTAKVSKEIKPRKRRQKGSQVKLQAPPKNTHSGSHALKRCFCTLKLKSKKNKPKVSKKRKGTSTAESSSSGTFRKNFQCVEEKCNKESSLCIKELCEFLEYEKRNKNRASEVGTNTELKTKKVIKLSKSGRKNRRKHQLLPYECEPGVCIPGECNPDECIKLINRRERKKRLRDAASGNQCSCKTKSTSSVTSKSITPSKVKRVQSNITTNRKSIPKLSREYTSIQVPQIISSNKNRQAVRIGSSFSFNIQFYKENIPTTPIKQPTNVKSITFKPKVKYQERPQQRNVRKNKSKPSQINKKEHNAYVGTTLKRCFCTLKLQKKEHKKRKIKMLSTGTDTVNPGYLTIEMSTKGTKMNRKDRNLLEPFECEPFTCIPGSCDPYICLERINKRNMRLKNVGLTTTSPAMITESSSTELEKVNKPAQIKLEQSSKTKKTLKKPYITKKINKKEKQWGSGDSSIKTKRAVRLGSTFSFDIQFYRNQYHSPEGTFKHKLEDIPFKISTNNKFKDRSIEKKVSNKSHVDTQIKVKSRHKAALVKPALKKCFCTLNLVKKQNKQYQKTQFLKNKVQPIVYTVNKIVTANTTFASGIDSVLYKNQRYSSSCNKYCKKYIKLNSISTTAHAPLKVKPRIEINNVSKQFSELSFRIEHANKINEASKTIFSKKKENSFLLTPEVTGLHRYLRQYYYTMNVQTKNLKILTKRNKPLQTGKKESGYHGRKLEPYECEPGICVPGECNPYDCQKLILERMKKHAAKKLGTESTSQSTSSYTGRNHVNFGTNKTQSPEKSITPHQKRKKIESVAHGHKQAVRLGSSFSFDIEFFKDRPNFSQGRIVPKYSSDTKLARRVKQKPKKFKTSGTKGHEMNHFDEHSQSGSFMADKASHIATDAKRCFCTLKLQKKGRLFKEHAKRDKIIKEQNVNKVAMATRGQNTAKMKPIKIKRKLDPYECEPGICVPGSCDPYKCLEIMKSKRTEGQQFGTNTTSNYNSVSSMTTSSQKKYRDHAIGAKIKQDQSKLIATRKYKVNKSPMPSRQCVRIGSSFSFNVEFYKDNQVGLQKKENVNLVHPEKISRPVHHNKKTKQKGLQNYKDLKHMDSQIKSSPLNASTMTKSLIKRCFCTAQLNAPKETQESQTKQPGAFKKRCMCVLRLLKKTKLPPTPAEVKVSKPLMASKKINTRYAFNSRPLEPYECLPGICTPGECDPYKCYEIMNKRRIDTYSRASATNKFKTRKAGSHTSDVLTKHTKTQMMRTKVEPKYTQRKAHIETPHRHESGRQAVKIGSNFSFNIEFYKQNQSDIHEKTIPKLKYYNNVKPSKIKVNKPKIKSTGANIRPITFSTTTTQALGNKKENRAIDAKPLLKRCFCVLKLRNQGKQNIKKKEIKVTKPKVTKMETKSVMTVEKIKWNTEKLEPYECEPNVCVPYQCDPIECEKRIKERLKNLKNRATAPQRIISPPKIKWRSDKLLPYECEPNVCIPYECDPYECKKRIDERLKKERHRESSTSTYRRRVTQASITDKFFTPKMKNQQTVKKAYNMSRKQQNSAVIRNESFVHPSRQSVKLGSSFTFNIEFYKNNKDGIDVVKLPKMDVRPVRLHKLNKNIQKQVKETGSQKLRNNKETKIIQFENEITKSQATMTNVSPFSNRCFCTLYVRKPKKEKILAIDERKIMATSNVSTETNTPNKLKLLPYECEPHTCVPGQCDPYECLERIKTRELHKKNVALTTNNYSKSVGSAFSGVSAKSKNKNIQTKHKAVTKQNEQAINDLNVGTTSRQVVRIGSNFSFDIEFYKDKIIDNNLNNMDNRQTDIKVHDNKITQNVNSSRPIQTQVLSNATKSMKSGISPILKRCFCTLKFQNTAEHAKDDINYGSKKELSKKINVSNHDTTTVKVPNSGVKPFIKKCFCNLKLYMQGNKDNAVQQKQNKNLNESKKVNTPKSLSMFKATNRKLEPYECEPGVCVPGLCDPYECEKRIRKRFLKALSTQTKRSTKNFATNHTDKNELHSVMIQSKPEKYSVKPEKEHLGGKRVEYKQVTNFVDNATNRQAVRIGSNFGFNIEFFKDSRNPGLTAPPQIQDTITTKKINRSEKKNQFVNRNLSFNQASQSTHVNKKSKGSLIMPALQRCFCTLKLAKTRKTNETINKQPILKSKSVATPKQVVFPKDVSLKFQNLKPYECEPFTCIPGECDPYECLKRIKMRGQTYKSQTTATQAVKYRPKSVGITSKSLKTQKNQSKLVDSSVGLMPTKKTNEQPRFVEIPRFFDFGNKNAVRIGSNFNFNIEFYKETIPQTVVEPEIKVRNVQNAEYTSLKPKNKKLLVKRDSVQNRQLQNDIIKTNEQGSDTGNRLKRCFCTLKLQKKDFPREMKNKIAYPVLTKNQYPQIFDVRMVSVQNKTKKGTNPKFSDAKSVATKVSKSFYKQCVCQEKRNKNIEDMHTILPYVPTKFNKNVSKTLLTTNNRNKGETSLNTPIKLSFDKRRKLTKKKSHKSINKSHNQSLVQIKNNTNPSFLHRLFCKCVNTKMHSASIPPHTQRTSCDIDTCEFQKQNKVISRQNEVDLHGSKSDRHHRHLSGSTTTKKSKSLKTLKRHRDSPEREMSSNLPVSDPSRVPRISLKDKPAFCLSDLVETDHEGKKHVKSTILKHRKGNEHNDTLCTHCEMQFKKKVHFQDSLSMQKHKISKNVINKSIKEHDLPSRNTRSRILSKNKLQLKDSQKISKSCNYCDLCGSRVDKEEIQKAAGDRRYSKLTPQKISNFILSKTDMIKSLFGFDDVDNVCSGEINQEPLFEMKLDSQNFGLLNKDEVIRSVTRLRDKMKKDKAIEKRVQLLHGKSCRCCICLGKKNKVEKYVDAPDKGPKTTELFGNMFGSEKKIPPKVGSGKPCVCGSSICEKELRNLSVKKKEKKGKRVWRPCSCGGPICKHESQVMKILSTSPEKISCQCREEMAKRKMILLKNKMKDEAKKRAIRLKKYQKEDEIRRKKRIKQNFIDEKTVKDNARHNDSDFLMLAESALDVAKLGFTATSDTIRCAARTALDPKGTLASISAIKHDPFLIFRGAKNAVADSGVASTLRRIKYRWCAMRTVTDVKGLMEQHPFTNFILNIGDKDRRSGRKKKRVRERYDFSCSLYMATLRKRPCLCLYDRCPWFYPHFMSILNVWKQFSDIVLFLIAVVVWSPCILAMELCRAMMCCFLCTG